LRFAQELDNFLELFFGFVHAGDIFEGDLLLLRRMQARARLLPKLRTVPIQPLVVSFSTVYLTPFSLSRSQILE
jgi:hypothetical protein